MPILSFVNLHTKSAKAKHHKIVKSEIWPSDERMKWKQRQWMMTLALWQRNNLGLTPDDEIRLKCTEKWAKNRTQEKNVELHRIMSNNVEYYWMMSNNVEFCGIFKKCWILSKILNIVQSCWISSNDVM